MENSIVLDTAKPEERRRFWNSRSDTHEQSISTMLAEDHEMQLLAVNMLFCRVYEKGRNSGFDKSFLQEMPELAKLQNDFLTPASGLADYLLRR